MTGHIPPNPKNIRRRAIKRCNRRKIKPPEAARGWLGKQVRGGW